jgi:hypothetical protein
VQDAEELAAWLSEHVLPQGHPDEHVNAAAYQRLRDLGIEPPTPDRLERVLASASSAFEERFCTETIGRFPPATLERLEALLSVGWSLRFCRLTILQLYRPMNCASSAKTPICGMVLKQRARNSSRFAKVFE